MSVAAYLKIAISVISGSLALCLNTLLAIIIITTTCSYIGKYKYLLFLYTVLAATYSLGQLTTATCFLVLSDGYVFYDSIGILPNVIGHISISMYMSSFVQNIGILTLSFSYRYFVICDPEALKIFMENWFKIAITSGITTIYVAAALVYALLPSSKCEELFDHGFREIVGYNLTDTGYSCGIIYYHGQFNWILFFAFLSLTILIFAAGGIIITVAIRTARKLKIISKEFQSKTMANQQKKIFTLLLFQITLPLLSNMLPIQFVVISAFFQLPTNFLVHNIGCVLTIAQIIDPVLTFYFIGPYRKALYRKLFAARISSTGYQ